MTSAGKHVARGLMTQENVSSARRRSAREKMRPVDNAGNVSQLTFSTANNVKLVATTHLGFVLLFDIQAGSLRL